MDLFVGKKNRKGSVPFQFFTPFFSNREWESGERGGDGRIYIYIYICVFMFFFLGDFKRHDEGWKRERERERELVCCEVCYSISLSPV